MCLGCLTCRERRVKCDEVTPACFHCERLSLKCEPAGEYVPRKEQKARKAKEARERPPKVIHPKTTTDGALISAQAGFGSVHNSPPSVFTHGLGPDIAGNPPFPLPLEGDFLEVMFAPFPFYHPSPLSDMALESIGLLASLPTLRPLSEDEHRALDYYQKEIAFGFGTKSPAWSTHAILMKTARRSSAVLHLLLAACLAEMGWLSEVFRPMLDRAGENYRLGRQLLEGEITDSTADPLVVMASFWFLYLQQRRRATKFHMAYGELSRMMSEYFRKDQLHQILVSAPEEEDAATQTGSAGSICSADRKALLARLTSWLFWVDVQSCFQGDGGSMARLLAQPTSPQGLLDLYETSRATLQLHWDGDYPDDELTDDLQNSSALELIHHTWVLVQEINDATTAGESSLPITVETARARDIKTRMDALRRKYPISSVFRLASSPTRVRNRLLANADWAVANYYALRIYYFRCSLTSDELGFAATATAASSSPLTTNYASSPKPPRTAAGIAETVDETLLLIQKTLETGDRGQTDRMQWPLFWVGVETTDGFKQRCILGNLRNRELHDALQIVFLEQAGGARASIARIRQICQAACVTVPEPGLGVYGVEM
ncbi:hypothetical protein B0T26DRAFT_138761 [Lasiosphaeria miniovina]|uniref:Zn(2)-C6 fungal-type domain-containing protein n=1 Tax=Lasiosphaeria miniovina TaxID=1954250 RepID=A0AA40E9P1_9PEZI|nr:uncharacterized protein B0T26DRAFT_138761 [Lasiosphaeria miniovina]KAK0727518.1 hypothetical protein B0T26DRAFT_138761 [Lasiosphaeria miniovina]